MCDNDPDDNCTLRCSLRFAWQFIALSPSCCVECASHRAVASQGSASSAQLETQKYHHMLLVRMLGSFSEEKIMCVCSYLRLFTYYANKNILTHELQ